MANSTNGIIVIEGLGERQARSGLHRMLARHITHNPVCEDRASKPEQYQLTKPRSRDHSCGKRATGRTLPYGIGGG